MTDHDGPARMMRNPALPEVTAWTAPIWCGLASHGHATPVLMSDCAICTPLACDANGSPCSEFDS